MLGPWRVLECAPDTHRRPPSTVAGDLVTVMDVPTTMAVLGMRDTDSHDYWCLADVEFDEPTCIEFTGLTFPATVFLDGLEVSRCESMFLPVAVDVPGGRHEIAVHFGSLTQWLATRRPRGRWRSGLVSEPGLRWARTTLIGRAPVYGDLPAPVGFWRPIATRRPGSAASVEIAADAASGTVRITATELDDAVPVAVTLSGPGGATITQSTVEPVGGVVSAHFTVEDPRRWWPRHYGEQALYQLSLQIGDRSPLIRRFGFRTVTRSDDPDGFGVEVNGVPIFCRGAVWVPPDPVGLTATEDVLRDRLGTLAEAGVNMLRITGGLVHEQPEFWSLCADLGLLVWQDAMQSTFDPPDETGGLVVREMRHLLASISGNPSLAVVSGGSEMLQRPEMLGLAGVSIPVIDTALPRIVAEHSDAVYVRSSPAPPDGRRADLAIRPDTGIAHWFGVGGYLRPLADVARAQVRFAAECLAFSIPPAPPAVEHHFGSSAAAGHHPRWKAGVPRDRGASWDFEDVRDFYVREIFGEEPLAVRRTDPDRYLQLGRLAVGEAMRTCFAYWRQPQSLCRGALVLAAGDLTPGAGWGLLDVEGQPKAPLDMLRRVWAPAAVVVSDDGLAGVRVDIHNDTSTARVADLRLIAVNSVGHRIVDIDRELVVPARGTLTLRDADVTGKFCDLSHAYQFGAPVADAIEARVRFHDDGSEVRDAWVIAPRTGQVHTALAAVAAPGPEGAWELEVSAQVALRYVWIDAPGWQPCDNGFHLLPGHSYTVRLVPTNDQTEPSGWISSIDAITANAITLTSTAQDRI